MFVTKTKIVTTLIFAAGLVTAAGAWTHQALRAREQGTAAQVRPAPGKSDLPAPRETPRPTPAHAAEDLVTCSGRVLGPDGNPFAGAKLYLLLERDGEDSKPAVRATTGADGRFRLQARRSEFAGPQKEDGWPFVVVVATAKDHGPDWALAAENKEGELTLRLVRNDVSFQGRVVDLQGKPVAGAVVQVRALATTPEEDLAPVLKLWRTGRFGEALGLARKQLLDPVVAGLPKRLTTGADGHFRLPGAGRERLVSLSVEAPGLQKEIIRVIPRPAAEIKTLVEAGARASVRPSVIPSAGPPLYGTTFDHVAGPTRLVAGTVRDRETRKPLAGVAVSGTAVGGHWEDVRTVSDDQGNFHLAGLPKAAQYRLYAWPPEGKGFLPVGTEVAGGDGLEALRVDFEIPHGVEVRGRVTDKRTGQPIPYVGFRYAPLPGNKHPGISAYRYASVSQSADAQGTFRLLLPPGPGVIFAVVRDRRDGNRYTQARLAPADKEKAYKDSELGEAFLAASGAIETLHGTNAYRLIDPPTDAKAVTCNFELDPGQTRAGNVLGPDGQPLAGAVVSGLTAIYPRPVRLKDAAFTAVALDPETPRDVLFVHLERKLAGRLTVRGDQPEPLTVKLEPWGALTGRLVDADGQPLAGVRVSAVYVYGFVHVPVAWMEPHPEEIRTDRDGRFRVERLIPGLKATLGASAGKSFLLLGDSPRGQIQITVMAGETRELGDVRARTNE
jgi:protocatechuate 3,4-dioxygenase beta subunit